MASEYQQTAKILKALSDPTRLKIVSMLSEGELCAGSILESFQVSQPTLSHDMKLLIESGLIADRREGKRVIYSVNREAMDALLDTLCRMTGTSHS